MVRTVLTLIDEHSVDDVRGRNRETTWHNKHGFGDAGEGVATDTNQGEGQSEEKENPVTSVAAKTP